MNTFFNNVLSNKKHKNAFLLGCGSSINDLNDVHIGNMHENFDIWTSNNFIIHKKIVPNFYHLEVKPHRNGQLITRLTHEKRDLYKDVSWLLDKTRPYIFDFLSINDYNHKNFYLYDKAYRKETHGNYLPNDNFASVSANASMTVISDIIVRMNYDVIYTLGIDMNTSEYFWTNNSDYNDVIIEDIIKTTKPDERHPKEPHPTAHMTDYIPEFMRFNNQKIINLSQNSLLKDKITTQTISEIL
jgi:hypothetical protein